MTLRFCGGAQMGDKIQMPQVVQLFEKLLPLSNAERNEYLALHSELPSDVVAQTLSLLQADKAAASLPSLSTVLGPAHKQAVRTSGYWGRRK
jgi:hypothetical protein